MKHLMHEVDALLKRANINPEDFDTKKVKTREDLLAEWNKGEISIEVIDGQLWRRSQSARLIFRTPDMWLLEQYRRYPNGKIVQRHTEIDGLVLPPNWSISETIRPEDDDPVAALVRGLSEEMRLIVPKDSPFTCLNESLPRLRPNDPPQFKPWSDRHSSTVYYKTTTETKVYMYEWMLREPFGDEEIVYVDDDGLSKVELHLRWVPNNFQPD